MRRPLALTLLTAVFASSTASGLAQSPPAGGGPSQNIVADNSTAASVLARSGLQLARSAAKDASPANLARANAHDCATPCQAIAAAFQIVLVPAGATVQAPQNVALATNVNCSQCGAFAYAYQYVVTVSKGTNLDPSARAEIGALRNEVAQDVHAGLAYPDLDARLHEIAQRFRALVDASLTRQGVGESNKKSNQDLKEGPQTTAGGSA